MNATHSAIPNHVGLILDGNRRWAKSKGLQPVEGHKKGYENLKIIVEEAFKLGVNYVSAFVFSTENWQRSKPEVDYLMKLLAWVVRNEVNELHEKNIRILVAGSRDRLNKKVVQRIEAAEEKTANNNRGTLVLCLNYGGQQEIVTAVKKALQDGTTAEDLNEEIISKNLYAPEVPAIDLVIRTSGEQRLSNFMLWRAAYSELYFTDKYWPDFSAADLKKALKEFASRQRRFGK